MFDLVKFSGNVACVSETGEQLTYASLHAQTLQLASRLEPHALMFCLCSNNVGSLAGYISATNAGVPVLLLDAHIEPSALQHLVEVYRPVHVWQPATAVALPQFAPAYAQGTYMLYTTQADEATRRLPADLAVLLTTSGSTGSPKLVRLTEWNLVSNAQSIIGYLHITAAERPVTSLPMYYSFGLSIVNSHLMVGATLLLTDASYVQKAFWDFANAQGFTSFSGIPYTFDILKKLRFWTMKCPTLKTITQAGGHLRDDLVAFFSENAVQRGIQFYVMYGQTEAAPRMSYLPPQMLPRKLGSIGIAVPGGTFSLEDEDGRPVTATETVGELVFRGENVCLGYAQNAAELYDGDDNKGVLHTGDMAYCDADGYYYITGRKKRFVKLFGNRVSLDYVETLLLEHLRDCACVGNDQKLIVYTTDADCQPARIIDLLVERTKILRTVFQVRIIGSLPRSASGKILYKELPIDSQ